MAAAVAAKVRRDSLFQTTHFLGLPLYNSKSRSQLENFAHKLRNDEYAEDIPHRAFRFPATFHIPVADFILETDRDVKAALNLLRRLDIKRILKESATSTATAGINEQPDIEEAESVTRRGFDKSVITPLQVSLTGVERTHAETMSRREVRGLYGTVNEPSGRLRGFVSGVRHEFASAGFQMYSGLDNEDDYLESKSLVYQLMNNRDTRKYKTFVDYSGNIVRKRRKVQYDATALCQRYENVEIARDIIIEKLSLCKEGCKRTYRGDHKEFVVDEYYEEIDSIPMPQRHDHKPSLFMRGPTGSSLPFHKSQSYSSYVPGHNTMCTSGMAFIFTQMAQQAPKSLEMMPVTGSQSRQKGLDHFSSKTPTITSNRLLLDLGSMCRLSIACVSYNVTTSISTPSNYRQLYKEVLLPKHPKAAVWS